MGLDSQKIDNAIALARAGWRIIPVHDVARGACSCGKPDCDRNAGKHPRMSKWGESATIDEGTIRGWFAKWPSMNFGIATGPESGIWVLDVEAEGLGTLETLERENGKLPATFMVKSGGGGKHFYFRWPADGTVIPSRGVPSVAKIDTRGAGGQIVGPGSRSPKGEYTILADEPIADAPQWLLDLVVRPSTPAPATLSLQPSFDIGDSDRVRRARAYLDKIPGGVDGEHGSNPCLWAASVLVWGYCLDRGTARQLMGEYSARCSPPWSEKEIEHKLDDAAKGGIGKPLGWLLDARSERNNPPAPSASPGAATTEPERPRFDWIDSADFDEGDYRPTYLIECALVANEPAILAAPTKSMKTSIGVDACISIAAGLPFLGRFHVPAPIKVAIASMESGKNTLQGTMRRVCKSKGITPADLTGQLVWTFNVPRFDQPAAVAEFVLGLQDRGVEAVLLDPAYLCLGEVDEKSIFDVGRCLRSVAEMMVPKGITPIIVHHANRGLTTGEKMDLQHIAYSGFDAFARQFWLANRREKYTHDGNHKLWLSVGGSAGHGGLYAVDIAEGLTDRNFGGRYWDVTVTDAAELRQDAAEDREAKAAAKVREKFAGEEEAVLAAIDAATQCGQPGETKTQIRKRIGWQTKRLNDVLDRLQEEGRIQPHNWNKETGNGASTPVSGYRRPVVGAQTEMSFDERPANDGLPTVLPTVTTDSPGQDDTVGRNGSESSPPIRGALTTLPTVRDPKPADTSPKTGRRSKGKRHSKRKPIATDAATVGTDGDVQT